MIQSISIKNFKSIADDTIELGRVNVFIGENGCGKSNLLEAVAFASAANENQLNHESLYNKGFRNAKPDLIISAFKGVKQAESIKINLYYSEEGSNKELEIIPHESDNIHSDWEILKVFPFEIDGKIRQLPIETIDEVVKRLSETLKKKLGLDSEKALDDYLIDKLISQGIAYSPTQNAEAFSDFCIYTLNTKSLRGIYQESQKRPLGINGENLDVLLANFDKDEIAELKNYNNLISWLDDFYLDEKDTLKLKGYKLNKSRSTLYFADKFMQRKNNIFSSENANEGILHILFYLALMISKRTPKFFAIDNIESCLNPHLCRKIMEEICVLAKKESIDKQVLITTHNPAILDGMNLNDDEIRLFEVYRNEKGHTKTRRIKLNPDTKPGQYKLSELWMRGYFGGNSNLF